MRREEQRQIEKQRYNEQMKMRVKLYREQQHRQSIEAQIVDRLQKGKALAAAQAGYIDLQRPHYEDAVVTNEPSFDQQQQV